MPQAVDGMKVCIACKEDLPIARFAKHQAASDRLHPRCRVCERAYAKEWRDANPERVAERQKWLRIKHRYGLTREQYEAMLADQNDVCAICHNPQSDWITDALYVDHCHATKRVRGLLCAPCNSALGHMKDDPERLIRAAEYLRKFEGA